MTAAGSVAWARCGVPSVRPRLRASVQRSGEKLRVMAPSYKQRRKKQEGERTRHGAAPPDISHGAAAELTRTV
ncbi:hypothetical protein GBS0709_27580 [Edwardsiella tarda]|nr:hypothetical protein GBS0709_27580 [Edwardsiella tarda]